MNTIMNIAVLVLLVFAFTYVYIDYRRDRMPKRLTLSGMGLLLGLMAIHIYTDIL